MQQTYGNSAKLRGLFLANSGFHAADDRGIGIVRGQILNFASTRTIYNGGYKEWHQSTCVVDH